MSPTFLAAIVTGAGGVGSQPVTVDPNVKFDDLVQFFVKPATGMEAASPHVPIHWMR